MHGTMLYAILPIAMNYFAGKSFHNSLGVIGIGRPRMADRLGPLV